jgi:hypothetical protein
VALEDLYGFVVSSFCRYISYYAKTSFSSFSSENPKHNYVLQFLDLGLVHSLHDTIAGFRVGIPRLHSYVIVDMKLESRNANSFGDQIHTMKHE